MAAISGRDAAGPRRESGLATRGRAVLHGTDPGGARSVLYVLMVPTFLSGVVDADLRSVRRAASVIAMLVGAIAGAALYVQKGPSLPLVIAAAAAAITAVAAEASSSIRGYLDKK